MRILVVKDPFTFYTLKCDHGIHRSNVAYGIIYGQGAKGISDNWNSERTGSLIEIEIFIDDSPWLIVHMMNNFKQMCRRFSFKTDDDFVDHVEEEDVWFLRVVNNPTGTFVRLFVNSPAVYYVYTFHSEKYKIKNKNKRGVGV